MTFCAKLISVQALNLHLLSLILKLEFVLTLLQLLDTFDVVLKLLLFIDFGIFGCLFHRLYLLPKRLDQCILLTIGLLTLLAILVQQGLQPGYLCLQGGDSGECLFQLLVLHPVLGF